MKNVRISVMLMILAALGAVGTQAQRRRPVKKPTTVTVPPLDVRAAREKVGIQLSNVNDFIDKLGTIAQGLEVADKDAQAGSLKPATAAKIEAKKREIVEAIRNIKLGLGNLESEFRTKPVLQKYLPTIKGITDLAAQSEDLAIAGKFVAAKQPLGDIAAKLTDTLAILPK